MDLSAAKMYVSDAEWQNVVRDWLGRCAGVVLEAGDSSGLGWEIQQVALLVPPRRLLLICPISDAEYESFLRVYSGFFPLGLPSTRPRSRLLIFGDDWRSRELHNIDFDASKTLEPYFAQLRKTDAIGA